MGQGLSFDPTASPKAEAIFGFEANWTEVLFPMVGDVVETSKNDLDDPTFTFNDSRIERTYNAPQAIDLEQATVDTMVDLNPIEGTLKASTDADLKLRLDFNAQRTYTADYELSWNNFFLVEDEVSFSNFVGVVRSGIKVSGAISNRLEQAPGAVSRLSAESNVDVKMWLYDQSGQLDSDEFQSGSQPIDIDGPAPIVFPQNLTYSDSVKTESGIVGSDTLRVYARYDDSGKLAIESYDGEFVNLETDHEFQNTLIFTLDFYDQMGNHLPDFPYTSALGINYQSAVTAVPEPSSFLSLLLVLTSAASLRFVKRHISFANSN